MEIHEKYAHAKGPNDKFAKITLRENFTVYLREANRVANFIQ